MNNKLSRKCPRRGTGSLDLVLGILIGCAGLVAGCNGSPMEGDPGGADNTGDRVQGEYVVELNDESTQASVITELYEDLGVESLSGLETNQPLYLLRVANDPGPAQMAERAEKQEAIKRVQPNRRYGHGEGSSWQSGDELEGRFGQGSE